MRKLQSVIDRVATFIAAVMCAVMMTILIVNIILRYTPGIGGFSWYMESSQYLNVWSMLIACIAISVRTEHLKGNLAEDMARGVGKKVVKIIVAIFNILFFIGMAYGTYLLATKARQTVSTMPMFKMAQVYWMLPITSVLSAISVAIGLAVDLNDMNGKEEEKA